jgi:hypothetical protein
LFILVFLKLNQNPATYASCCKRTLLVGSLKILVITTFKIKALSDWNAQTTA